MIKHLFKKKVKRKRRVRNRNKTGMGDLHKCMKIYCPSCKWQPDGKKYWGCEGCWTIFDTFATRANCPKCSKTWHKTQCIGCGELFPHEDFYHFE